MEEETVVWVATLTGDERGNNATTTSRSPCTVLIHKEGGECAALGAATAGTSTTQPPHHLRGAFEDDIVSYLRVHRQSYEVEARNSPSPTSLSSSSLRDAASGGCGSQQPSSSGAIECGQQQQRATPSPHESILAVPHVPPAESTKQRHYVRFVTAQGGEAQSATEERDVGICGIRRNGEAVVVVAVPETDDVASSSCCCGSGVLSSSKEEKRSCHQSRTGGRRVFRCPVPPSSSNMYYHHHHHAATVVEASASPITTRDDEDDVMSLVIPPSCNPARPHFHQVPSCADGFLRVTPLNADVHAGSPHDSDDGDDGDDDDAWGTELSGHRAECEESFQWLQNPTAIAFGFGTRESDTACCLPPPPEPNSMKHRSAHSMDDVTNQEQQNHHQHQPNMRRERSPGSLLSFETSPLGRFTA